MTAEPPAVLPDPTGMSDAELHAEITALIEADALSARRWVCDRPRCDGLPHSGWLHHHARATQRLPEGAWAAWMMLTGRGWGETKSAAEAVREWATTPGTVIAVVAKNATLVKEICFESPKSGLLAVFPPEDVRRYSPGNGLTTLRLKNGSAIYGFGAETPDNLRRFALYHEHQADCMVIEANNGGDYLPALLTEVDPTVPCRVVHATRGKRARAAPVAMLYEQSRISRAGSPRTFAMLEEQMTTYVGASEAEERSPDLLDSCVWALTDLFLDAALAGISAETSDRRRHGRR